MEDSLLFNEKEGEHAEKKYKILFTGLDGAGKTSIILALQREFSKIALIEPTKGAQRTTFNLLGREITEWDLGGQRSYLISYLENPSKYFDETEIAIYVIDILDASRTKESLRYLYDVVDKFKELGIEPNINIFFHKYDPKLIHRVEKQIKSEILAINKEIIERVNYEKLRFFTTSVYSPYTIMNAMSKILLNLYPKSELLQKMIEKFARKLDCEGLLITDKNSIILGSWFQDREAKKLLSSTIAYFLTLNDVFEDMGLDQQEDQILVRKKGKYFLFKPVTLKEKTLPYYMLVLKNRDPMGIYFINKDFDIFAHMFNNLVKS
ncbi:MAG: ADP-ribosylation factor-like protein [Candidatus Hermodarchaeota archaeon]